MVTAVAIAIASRVMTLQRVPKSVQGEMVVRRSAVEVVVTV
jgi:hypothetical protein